jgi:hypothetical protein
VESDTESEVGTVDVLEGEMDVDWRGVAWVTLRNQVPWGVDHLWTTYLSPLFWQQGTDT